MNMGNKKFQNVKSNLEKDITLGLLDKVEKISDTTQLEIFF